MKKKILFFIHDLGQGGAEKVLVNLTNNLDSEKYDVTVMTLFGNGINEQFLLPHIKLKSVFKRPFIANSQFLKLLSPKILHKWFIKESYDIEVSFLEGISARIISGCTNKNTKLVSWVHVQQHLIKYASYSFKSKKEAIKCYNRFDETVCVSQAVLKDFCNIFNFKKPCRVLYNVIESNVVSKLSNEEIDFKTDSGYSLIAVGSLKESKGYRRLFNVVNQLITNRYDFHLYVLGLGPLKDDLEKFITDNNLFSSITLLGYDTNPYKYISKCDLFVCASFAEGFSTAATEALIVGTPVCTVDVSGMKEMLGENNEFGVVVENSEEGLYKGIKSLLDNPEKLEFYKQKALERGKCFSIEGTVSAIEDLFDSLLEV